MVQEGELALNPENHYSVRTEATADSVANEPEPVYAVILTPPEREPAVPQRTDNQLGVSFILTGLFLLFLIVALRFRNNIKYVASIFRNLIETKTRHNVFDDTVRETSLVILLNILWCGSAGIILYGIYSFLSPETTVLKFQALEMTIGMAAAVCYTLFMSFAYYGVGWIFSDSGHARMWLKGFLASQGLMSPAFFVIALLAICYPGSGESIFTAAFFIFILAKFVFIWKGYRIFFTQFSSWVLFLCYLCSLEIVPLFLTYRLAFLFGELIA